MPRVMVTGGAGFIGSHTVDALVASKCDVIVVDDMSTGNIVNCNAKAPLYSDDIRGMSIEGTFKEFRPEYVYHFAAQSCVSVSVKSPEYDIDVNVIGLLNVLRLCTKYRTKKLIFSSSIETYGDCGHVPVNEKTVQRPDSPYGITKFAAERYLYHWCNIHALTYTVLRYGNVYGPRQRFDGEAGVVSIFINNVMNREPVRIDWDGEQKKDYTYISDIVAANMSVLDGHENMTYCIGNQEPVSVNTVYDTVTRVIGHGTLRQAGPRRHGDMSYRCTDYSKAMHVLDWFPVVSFEDGVKKTVEWFKSR